VGPACSSRIRDAALEVDISGSPQDYARGDMVDVEGWTGASDIAPVPLVLRPTIRRIIATKLDTPPVVPLAALTGATCNGSRLRTTGEVKEVSTWNGYLRLHVASAKHSVEVRVLNYPLLDMTRAVGTTIQVDGVCIQSPAGEAKVADLRVMVSDFSDLGLPPTLRASLNRATTSLPVVTRVDQIRRMPRAEAGRVLPRACHRHRHLRRSRLGPCCFSRMARPASSWRCRARRKRFRPATVWRSAAGPAPGNFAPRLSARRSASLDRACCPRRRVVSSERLMTGAEDSQWVMVRGVVRAMTRTSEHQLLLDLISDGSRLSVMVPQYSDALPTRLIDAAVSVEGVCGSIFNQKGQLIAFPDLCAHAVERSGGAAGATRSLLRAGAVDRRAHAVRPQLDVAGPCTHPRRGDDARPGTVRA
jgi:hypothetical protein